MVIGAALSVRGRTVVSHPGIGETTQVSHRGIVLATPKPLEIIRHSRVRAPATKLLPSRLLPRWARHLSKAQDAGDRLGIANAPIERHPFRFR